MITSFIEIRWYYFEVISPILHSCYITSWCRWRLGGFFKQQLLPLTTVPTNTNWRAPTNNKGTVTTTYCTTATKSYLVAEGLRSLINEALAPKARLSACTLKAGLGAVCLQHRGDRWSALASTSRALTSSEFNFTQTVIYVCSKYYVVQTKQTGVTSVKLIKNNNKQ